MEDTDIRDMVKRLSRPHKSGGAVIERAAILAEGGDVAAILSWITVHEGEAELTEPAAGGGLHGSRLSSPARSRPARYVLPRGALN
jgi:hypothetical protein